MSKLSSQVVLKKQETLTWIVPIISFVYHGLPYECAVLELLWQLVLGITAPSQEINVLPNCNTMHASLL